MEKQKTSKKNKVLLIIIIIVALLAFTLFGVFIDITISNLNNKEIDIQEEKENTDDEKEIKETLINLIGFETEINIRERITYIPPNKKTVKSSEIPKLDILKTTMNNILDHSFGEENKNTITFEEIKNQALKIFDIQDFNYYLDELYTGRYYMFAVRYYKFTKENNLYTITEISKDSIPTNAIFLRDPSDTTNNIEMIPLKATKQGDYINIYVAKTNFVQENPNFGFYNMNDEQVCYKLQYNNEKKQYDCVLSDNIVENYMEKFEIYKYRYKYENDTYKLISIN